MRALLTTLITSHKDSDSHHKDLDSHHKDSDSNSEVSEETAEVTLKAMVDQGSIELEKYNFVDRRY